MKLLTIEFDRKASLVSTLYHVNTITCSRDLQTGTVATIEQLGVDIAFETRLAQSDKAVSFP